MPARAESGTTFNMQAHRGGCHCGAVAFEVYTPDEVELVGCNCSMCAKTTPDVPSVQETTPGSTIPLPTALAA